jgi:multisubunit Na+/H+ antiporter MnhB subunit
MGIDFSQNSTKLGILVLIGVIVAMFFLTFSTPEKALTAISIIGTAVGFLGISAKS